MNANIKRTRAPLRQLWQRTRTPRIAALLLILSACSSVPSVPPTVPKQPPPASAMVDCNPATEPPDGTLQGLAYALDSTAWTLSTCRLAFKELRNWVNNEWSK